eukprot:g1779.t1
MEPVDGAQFIMGDFTWPETATAVLGELEGRPVDVLLSDMAPKASGDKVADHLRSVSLCQLALDFATSVMSTRNDSVFLCKLWTGKREAAFAKRLEDAFKAVRKVKPPASRAVSVEAFYYCKGLRKQDVGRKGASMDMD